MIRTGRLLAVLLAFAGALGSPRAARAGDRDTKAEARAEVQKATLNYKLGRFEEALAAYARAYELYNSPALLFNLGQCHKNLRNHERAIFFFQGYLREETDPDKRALAEELLAKSRAELGRQRQEPPPQSPPPQLFSPAAEATKVEPPKLAAPKPDPAEDAPMPATFLWEPASAPASELPPDKPLSRRWWFWTAIGAGALAIAGGSIAYYASGQTTIVPPTGTVGTLDRR